VVNKQHSSRGPSGSFWITLLVSAVLVLPFVGLQLINRRTYHEEFPVVLFTFMMLNSVVIILAMTPALRCLHWEKSVRSWGLGHWAGLALGVVLLAVYANVVVDQWPCFLGVPNCD
jgi:hypothetical protein